MNLTQRLRSERFPALRVIATILRTVTWLAILPMGLVAAVGFSQQTTRPMAIGFAVAAVVFWVWGMLVPELINLLLSIEANLHAIARNAARMPGSEAAPVTPLEP